MPLILSTRFALILTFILVAGCAGTKPAPRVVVEDTHTIVRLDVDQPCQRVGAVACSLRAAQYLHLLDVEQCHDGARATEVDVVDDDTNG